MMQSISHHDQGRIHSNPSYKFSLYQPWEINSLYSKPGLSKYSYTL